MTSLKSVVCLILCTVTLAAAQRKCPVLPEGSPLYRYGACEGDHLLDRNDDRSSWQRFRKNILYFGKSYDKVYASSNGAIMFTEDVYMGSPQQFTGNTTILAVFWADVDTRFAGGNVFMGMQESRGQRLERAAQDVKKILPNLGYFSPHVVIVVTWSNVTFFGASLQGREKRNTFQVVLVADETRTFAFYLYEQLTWTTGRTSGGNPNTGLGGDAAVVGYDVGNKVNWFTVPESFSEDILHVAKSTNIGGDANNGRWFFNLNPACKPKGAMVPDTNRFVADGYSSQQLPGCLQARTCCSQRSNTFWMDAGCKTFEQVVGCEGDGSVLECPNGLMFNTNPAICACDFSWRVKCSENEI